MSIAGATDTTRGRTGQAATRPFIYLGTPHSRSALNDNVERLFRWRGILRRLGISFDAAATVAYRAQLGGTTLQVEMVASSLIRERDLYRAIAAETGLPFQQDIEPRRVVLGGADPVALLGSRSLANCLKYDLPTGESCLLVAPELMELGQFQDLAARYPQTRHRVRVAAPSAMRNALNARAQPHLVRMGRDSLFLRHPELSARTTATAWQGVLLGGGAVMLAAASVIWPWQTLLGIHVFFSCFFFTCIALRLLAAFRVPGEQNPRLALPDAASMPHISILVALRHEADIVPDLLVALGRLVWPRSKLEIKLVCEADDRETLTALGAQQLRPWIEIVRVPDGMPKTKPNALSYALPMTRGAIISLFDAEDHPHPLQVVEAWRRLEAGGPDLACVQAPLDIDNAADGILPHAFQIEYAALFRGLLPWLSCRRQLLPLGGTSNHFRRTALEHVLAWDPYNVTEDADLGVRLARFGYRIETISLPTREDAPDTPLVWLRQRTRWFKGWTQTWLVHMRRPGRLFRELGVGSYALFQILFAGMLISALFHPLMLVTGVGLTVHSSIAELTSTQQILLAMDTVNIALGYGAFLLLAWRALPRNRRSGFWKPALFLPVYWLMMTAAAWRALYQIWRDPHLWEKTPHKRRRPPMETARQPSRPFTREASRAPR